MDEEIMRSIDEEINKLGGLMIEEVDDHDDEIPDIDELPQINEIKAPKKKRGQSAEQMVEVRKKQITKGQERRDLKAKKEETERIKKEKVELEYEEALRVKQAIEKRKEKLIIENNKPKIEKHKEIVKENKQIYKSASRDILKEKYMEEARKRVIMDLFT